jgi:hypothetical protein
MELEITKEKIDSVSFDEYYNDIIKDPIIINYIESKYKDDDINEFFQKPGKNHYRLLSYLSTLFNDSLIIDIGTHRGQSAAALSYNESNTIYTFDIFDKVYNKKIKTRNNIHFFTDDLFDEKIQEKWKNKILKSAFIFLDVDPHNGNMEFELYNYLKKIDYKGFVICDDIWHFKEMRDNFWYKIPDKYRYDFSHLGHFSGTGIICMNDDIHFFPSKNENKNWTLVTAYFNLTKCPDASKEIIERNQEYYMSHSISTLQLPYNLVIYCDEESLPLIQKNRPEYLKEKTRYEIRDFDDLHFSPPKKYNLSIENSNKNINNTFKYYRNKIIENRSKHPYEFDNRNTASYYLFCMSRYLMLKEAIENNYFNSTHFCWINFCIERMGYTNIMHLNEALSVNRDKFSTCYIDYVPENIIKNLKEYFLWGRCSMCSGFFTGNEEYMYKVCDLVENKFLEYLDLGYGHADEQLFSPVYFENPDMFEHYYGDYHQMITNYKYIYENPEAPVYNFIRNSFHNKNYKKCLEACIYVWDSYCLGKCNYNVDYIKEISYYYMMSKKEIEFHP